MGCFVIWNETQRKYVAKRGAKKSYVSQWAKAHTFPTREAAEQDCCSDEYVCNRGV